MTKDELKNAGFTDSEIQDYFAGQRDTLSKAGFSQREINTHFGQQTAVLENPDEAYKKGFEIQDLSIDLELPIEDVESNYNTIMELPDPDDVPFGIKAKENVPDEKPFEELRFTVAPPKTTWQKIKGFFVSDRMPLPPDADRIEKVDRAFDIVVGTPLRTFLKYAKGRTFGVSDLMWAGVKRITPDDIWIDEVRNMTLDEAMDWSAGYNPSGFIKMTGEIAEFIGRLQTARGLGIKTGLLGTTPKDMSVLMKAWETAKLFGIAATVEQITEAVATKIDPTEAEYGYEGATAVLRDMAIGAALSIASSGVKAVWSKLTPTEQARALKTLGLKKGATDEEITTAARQLARQYHPDKAKGFIKEFDEMIKARNLLRMGEPQDIVVRGQKVIIKPKLITGKEIVGKPITKLVKPTPKPPAVAPVAKVAPTPTAVPPKAAEAVTEPIKEIKYEKEAITEPATSLEMEPKKAGELVPTGKLDPTKPEEALKLIKYHAKWLTDTYGEKRIAVGGIFETKYDKEKDIWVVSSVEYTPAQIDTAYRNVQKSVPSPMPDTELFAMPGKEAQMQAIAQKMQRVKGVSRKVKKVAKLTKPTALPKAKIAPADHIKAIYKAAAKEQTRYAISGVKVEGDTIVVTDGRRLFWAKGKWGKDGIYLDDASLKKGLLGKPTTKKDLIFPKWRDIVPDVSGEKPILIEDLATTLRHIRQAASITTEESKGVTIIANKDGSLGFAAASPEVGHVEINVYPGGKILGGVNPQFFLDVINFHAIRGDRAFEFYFLNWDRPMLTKSLNDKTFTVTMPINIEIETPSEAIKKAISERPTPTVKPGFIDVEPLQKSFNAVLKIFEPSKLTEISLGREVSATVIRGIHKPDVARIEFNEKTIETLDSNLADFGKKLSTYSNRILELLMLSRGKPASAEAIAIRNDALKALVKEAPELVGTRKMVTRIADFNYKFLTEVVGDKIGYVSDYFYGIYKDPKKVDRFLDYWKTTKRFTKEKKLPTVADAKAYGLDLRNPNPVDNLRSEYMAIARLDGMIWMRDELLRTGEDLYISKDPAIIANAEKIPEPVFKGLWLEPTLAREIKSLISANKVAQVPALNALRKTNNFLRSIKFIFSAFHHLVIAKQSAADSGYLGFLYKPTALRGVTLGFKKSDPIFQTAEYKDYIEHGGGHRYSIDSEAERAFVRNINKLTSPIVAKAGVLGKPGEIVAKLAITPITVPKGYVKWLFEKYIPKVKYTKYLDTVNEKQKKLGRELTPSEKVEIIKEGQNFYGMMNEKLFGRSGTATTVLRFKFMAPGFAEGNYRTMLKAITQWGQEGTWNAGRSRANIVNSLLLTAIAATAGTLAFTGRPPEVPETLGDIRDLFKIDTGKVDAKGRKIMIDMMTYDKDYWTVFGKPLVGQAGEVPRDVIRRIGGMTSTTFEMISDLNQLSMGKAIYDWKGDRVVEVTDPFLKRAIGLIAFETQKVEPISTNIYRQSRERGLDRLAAAITTLGGWRPTTSEKDRRESQIISRIFSIRDRQERLYHFLGSIKNPQKHIDTYNRIAQSVLDNPVTTSEMKRKWGKNLVIDTDRLIANKVHSHELLKVSKKPKPDELERAKKWLTNFEVLESQFRKHLIVYEMKHRQLITEMKAGDADEMLKQEIAKFYADKGIMGRKVAGGTATDQEKRLSRRYEKLSSNISIIGTRLNKTIDLSDRRRFYERIKLVIERAAP